MLRQIVLNLFLALVWVLLQNSFTVGNLIAGFIVGAIVLYIFRRSFRGGLYLSRITGVIELSAIFLWELLKANFTVAALVLSRRINLRPAIVAVPIELGSDIGIVLLANMITLTPGTLSLEVAPDHKRIFVHVLNVTSDDQVREVIKEKFERRIARIVGGRQNAD